MTQHDPQAGRSQGDETATIVEFPGAGRREVQRRRAEDFARYWDLHLERHDGNWKSAIGEIICELERRQVLRHGRSS